jgi:hypothetical protein
MGYRLEIAGRHVLELEDLDARGRDRSGIFDQDHRVGTVTITTQPPTVGNAEFYVAKVAAAMNGGISLADAMGFRPSGTNWEIRGGGMATSDPRRPTRNQANSGNTDRLEFEAISDDGIHALGTASALPSVKVRTTPQRAECPRSSPLPRTRPHDGDRKRIRGRCSGAVVWVNSVIRVA